MKRGCIANDIEKIGFNCSAASELGVVLLVLSFALIAAASKLVRLEDVLRSRSADKAAVTTRHRHADQTYKPALPLRSSRHGDGLSGGTRPAGDSHEFFRCAVAGVSTSAVVATLV